MNERIDKLRNSIDRRGIGCCIIHKAVNIYYFSCVFPREPAFLIVPQKKEPTLVVAPSDFRYAEESSTVEVVKGRMDIAGTARDVLKGLGCPPRNFLGVGKSVGIEEEFIGVGILNALGVEKYMDVSPVIAGLRSIKDRGEIKNIKKSVEISEKAMEMVFLEIKEGKTEKEISGLFDYEAKRLGAGDTKARVLSGKNSIKPFLHLTGDAIGKGPLLIDYGTTCEKYWTDIARTFHLGKPDREFVDIYGAVTEALDEGIKHARAGEEIGILDERVREILKGHGYEKYIVYASGHGCGLEHEEPPIITREKIGRVEDASLPLAGGEMQALYELSGKEEETLKENMVITIEPGVYTEDYGVRVEEMILIGKRAKVLSRFPKSLEEIII